MNIVFTNMVVFLCINIKLIIARKLSVFFCVRITFLENCNFYVNFNLVPCFSGNKGKRHLGAIGNHQQFRNFGAAFVLARSFSDLPWVIHYSVTHYSVSVGAWATTTTISYMKVVTYSTNNSVTNEQKIMILSI